MILGREVNKNGGVCNPKASPSTKAVNKLTKFIKINFFKINFFRTLETYWKFTVTRQKHHPKKKHLDLGQGNPSKCQQITKLTEQRFQWPHMTNNTDFTKSAQKNHHTNNKHWGRGRIWFPEFPYCVIMKFAKK